jgi:putative transposase
MARPARNSDPEAVRDISRTFFVTSKTAPGKAVLRAERMALLMIDVLRSYVSEGKFVLHDFVVMPDHIHLQLSLDQMMSVEKAMQLVKRWFLVSCEEGIRLHGRDLAARIFRGKNSRPEKFFGA